LAAELSAVPSRQLFAVVRFDSGWREGRDMTLFVKVVAILKTFELADAEVRRLESINSFKGMRYVVQSTRWRGKDELTG
jgi:hypothetical protein